MAHSPAAPDTAEGALSSAVRSLHRAVGGQITFGGRIEQDTLRLTQFVGARTSLLRDLPVRPDAGAGGRSWARRQIIQVSDYRRSPDITHDYDAPVVAEGIRALVAAPVVVRDVPRAVLYLASRGAESLGDRVMSTVSRAAATLAHEIAVQDEVERRVRLVQQHQADGSQDSDVLERVRLAHAELRSLATTVEDDSVRARLAEIEALLAGSRVADGERVVRLSNRERDVLALVALGCSYVDVAARLLLSPQSVKTYMRNVIGKLEVHNRHEAVIAARRLSLIP